MDCNKDESLRANPSPCDTFWTICNHCKVHYEHLKKYLNCTLLCNNCKTPFMALATPPPQKFPKSSSQVPKQRQQSSSNHVRSQTQRRNMSSAEKQVAGQAGPLPGKSDPSVGATTVHMDHGAQDKLKRAFAESSSKEKSVKKRKLEDYSTYSQPNITRKLTALETRKMLIENTRKQILMKLSAWGSTIDDARGNVGGSGTNKNEHPELSHPQQIRNQIEVMRGKGLKMLLVLSCVQALGGLEVSWSCIIFSNAVSIAQTEEDPEAAARKLTKTAFTRGSCDNITCILVESEKDSGAEPVESQESR